MHLALGLMHYPSGPLSTLEFYPVLETMHRKVAGPVEMISVARPLLFALFS